MYHSLIMKLTFTLLILASAASAQTTTPKPATKTTTATKPVVHHTTPAAHPATACAVEGLPAIMPAAIPKTTGCAKPLYALKYVDTLVGPGTAISARKWITVNYTGYLVDGTVFDSSIGTDKDGTPKKPITFPYGAHQVIAGWDTGFEGMNIGGKRRLYIPYQLAYGEMGRPPVIPAKAMLIFDVELVGISDTPPPPPPGSAPRPPAAQPRPATPPSTPPTTTPGAGTTPAPDGAKPAPPAPTTDPTKPTATPPPTTPHM